MMAEAIPRLAVAMRSVLADTKIQLISGGLIEVRFNGLPAWHVDVTSRLVNNQQQLIETHVDVLPICLSSLTKTELARIAAMENLGLRGLSVLPIADGNKHGFRVRGGFLGQKGRSADEVESLAIDILTTISFARGLEDRLTDSSIAGEFSFELYLSRQPKTALVRQRYFTQGHNVFEGSVERVFAEVLKSYKAAFSFDIQQEKKNGGRGQLNLSAEITEGGARAHLGPKIVAKIPNDIPIFICQAPLLKLKDMSERDIVTSLADLNAQCEAGHYEFNPSDRVLSYTAWKHLTNDLRSFSFDHAIISVNRAFRMAAEILPSKCCEMLEAVPVRVANVIQFPTHTPPTGTFATGSYPGPGVTPLAATPIRKKAA